VQSFEETALELGTKFTLKDPVIMRGPDLIRLTKSDAFLETAPLFRTSRIRLVDKPTQVRELRASRPEPPVLRSSQFAEQLSATELRALLSTAKESL
jgi:hypothetical protein